MSRTRKRLLSVGLGLIWLAIFSLGVVIPVLSSPEHKKGAAPPLQNLLIFGSKEETFAEWERKEAIKFSLDQIDSSIKYLFIGAATILGFILKVLIEPHVIKKEQSVTPSTVDPINETTELLLIHSAIACLISIACGFIGRLYFSRLGDIEAFSIYDEVGFTTLGQLFAFVAGAIILLVAAISFLKTRRSKGV
jgi:hypothetical protein